MSLTKQRFTALTLAAVTALALVACDTAASHPDGTPETTPTATFTPAPITGIEIDPQANPAGFLAALPAPEVQCAASAVGGSANLELAVSMQEEALKTVTTTQLGIMAACFSDETVKRVVVGQLELATGGLSDDTAACIDRNAAGFDLSLLFSEGAASVDAAAYVSMVKTLFCLNTAERAAVEASATGAFGFSESFSIDAMECVVDNAGFDGITKVTASFGSSQNGPLDLSAMTDLFPAMVECGVLTDEDVANTGMTVDQVSCVIENTGTGTVASLVAAFKGSGTPDFAALAASLTALEACGLDLEGILETGETGTGAEGDEEGVTVPDGQGGTVTLDPAIFASLPITTAQAQCLINTIGLEQMEGIASGTVSPLTVLPALTTCQITIADLLGG